MELHDPAEKQKAKAVKLFNLFCGAPLPHRVHRHQARRSEQYDQSVKSNGKLDVAILSSATFDATTVDPASVTLAGAAVATQGKGTPMTSIADVNGDGRLDLLLHFNTQDLQLTKTDTQAVLTGQTFSGQLVRGTDSIRIVP